MMSGSKAPDFDAYGLFRATHSHNTFAIQMRHLKFHDITISIHSLWHKIRF